MLTMLQAQLLENCDHLCDAGSVQNRIVHQPMIHDVSSRFIDPRPFLLAEWKWIHRRDTQLRLSDQC